MRGQGRGFRLNLDGIEDISDCDVDSIKNTSARAITFNQFEQTKNNLKFNGDQTGPTAPDA
jgi:hypothetical protein